MASIASLPLVIEDSDKAVSLDDLLGTLKTAYTVTACEKCGRLVTLPELTTAVEPELALA